MVPFQPRVTETGTPPADALPSDAQLDFGVRIVATSLSSPYNRKRSTVRFLIALIAPA
jgi:hypothetical protein